MTGIRKIFLILLGIVILGMFGLSVGLTGLTLLPGKMLPFNGMLPAGNYPLPDIPGGMALLQAVRIIYLIALIVTPVMMIYIIVSPKARRRFLKILARSLPFILGFFLVIEFLKRLQANTSPTTPLSLAGPGNPSGQPGIPTPALVIPGPSETAIVVISAILSLFTVAIIGGALLLLWRRRRNELTPNRLIARQAQSALDALQAGGDLKNTIIRCYYQMSAVINQQRGILRSQTMTPHEFETYLSTNGLPAEPVHQLTHLFEEVRYGDQSAGPVEEQAALSSLTAIVEACGRMG